MDKNNLADQYNELLAKARELYPDIDNTITEASNITAQTKHIEDYLNLIHQTPAETSNNQIRLSSCLPGEIFSVK